MNVVMAAAAGREDPADNPPRLLRQRIPAPAPPERHSRRLAAECVRRGAGSRRAADSACHGVSRPPQHCLPARRQRPDHSSGSDPATTINPARGAPRQPVTEGEMISARLTTSSRAHIAHSDAVEAVMLTVQLPTISADQDPGLMPPGPSRRANRRPAPVAGPDNVEHLFMRPSGRTGLGPRAVSRCPA